MRINQQTMIDMAVDLLVGRYPGYVYGRRSNVNEAPPVLCYHHAMPGPLEKLLQFLTCNGYQTLDCDAYVDHLYGVKKAPQRSVLLTFDDGWGSMWSVAYPLLKKYQLKATVFLIPGRIHNNTEGAINPTLDDVDKGDATLEEVVTRDLGDQPLATWDELRDMHASGNFDFQCHTLLHDVIITDPDVTGFVTPLFLQQQRTKVLSLYDDVTREGPGPEPGAPLYEVQSRMAGGCKVDEDTTLYSCLVQYVDENGGVSFFDRSDWQDVLYDIVRKYRNGNAATLRQESFQERDDALYVNLAEAKQLIERHLPGKTVRHLAFPWGIGSEAAIQAAKRAGYVSSFWGKVDGRLCNYIGNDPFKIARLGEDFAALLPGTGRSRLPWFVWKKLRKHF
jgi:hypothetical protein